MCAAGKSTVAKALAATTESCFGTDSDKIIENNTGYSLSYIKIKFGYKVLKLIEEETILKLPDFEFLATGGSIIYSNKAMEHLASISTIVYLKVPYSVIEERVKTGYKRTLLNPDTMSLKEIYKERIPLYKQWADVTIDGTYSVEKIVDIILKDKIDEAGPVEWRIVKLPAGGFIRRPFPKA